MTMTASQLNQEIANELHQLFKSQHRGIVATRINSEGVLQVQVKERRVAYKIPVDLARAGFPGGVVIDPTEPGEYFLVCCKLAK